MTITHNTTEPLNVFLETSLSQPGFFHSHVLKRAMHVVLIPISALSNALDASFGIFTGAFSLLTGNAWNTHRTALRYLSYLGNIISEPYSHLIKTIYPNAQISPYSSLTSKVNNLLKDVSLKCCKSENWFKRQITSRLTYGLMLFSSIVTRVAEAIIGVGAAVLSIATFGQFQTLNSIAYTGLQAPKIIKDIFNCASKIINPEVDGCE